MADGFNGLNRFQRIRFDSLNSFNPYSNMNILCVRIDNFSKPEVLKKIGEFLHSNSSHTIFTPNPEMLVDAQKDEYFKQVLNSGDLNVCDGFGLQLLSRVRPKADEGTLFNASNNANNNVDSKPNEKGFLTSFGITRYPGTDLMQDICALAEKQNKGVYLLGSGNDEVVRKTAETLQTKFPNLKIVGFHPGHQLTHLHTYKFAYNQEENNELIADIALASPVILFVAFGHGKQEKWIFENLKHLPSVKVAMGVGGAFDYISGKTQRPPLFLREIGLEWLYRLFKEPKRIGRIWKATFQFIYTYVRKK